MRTIRKYDASTWFYEGCESRDTVGAQDASTHCGHCKDGSGAAVDLTHSKTDLTLSHPRCVYQILKKHFARYTPEMVERFCGVPKDRFLKIAETFCSASGPEKTGDLLRTGLDAAIEGAADHPGGRDPPAFARQHWRPGGGILALRDHASIQGSTDIPTLYDLD